MVTSWFVINQLARMPAKAATPCTAQARQLPASGMHVELFTPMRLVMNAPTHAAADAPCATIGSTLQCQ
jgi:hypothetical protein